MRIVLVLVALAVLAGCGSDNEREASAPLTTRLTVSVRPKGDGGPATTRTVTDAHGLTAKAFAPVPAGAICTRIYGGAATATVKGRLDSEPIDAKFDLSGGCEIDRWHAAAAVLGDPPSSLP